MPNNKKNHSNKNRRKPTKADRQKSLVIIAVFLAAVLFIILIMPRVLRRLRTATRGVQDWSESEESIEVLNVHTENDSEIEAMEKDGEIYLSLAAINRLYLGETLFIDPTAEKIFKTTLAEGKTSQDFKDLPLLMENETVFVPLDWAGETYGFSVDRVSDLTIVTGPERAYEEETVDLPAEKPETPVVLSWYQDFDGSFSEETAQRLAPAMAHSNVISPTWYSLGEDGTFSSLANAAFVEQAHAQGLQVWALFENGFDDERTLKAIQSEKDRETLIEYILSECQTMGYEGVNMDFELLSSQTAGYFVEFIRELSAVLRPEGFLVSVDVHAPAEWSWYYRRDLLERACDYIVVMAYDEHYDGSEPGSTASMPFMQKAVADMLEITPADKLILGLPFYTRLWTIKGDQVSSSAKGMNGVEEYIKTNKLTPAYDEASGQNMVEKTEKDTLEQIWIEDASSMEKRLDLASEKEIAGVACWKAGLEKEDIWALFDTYRAEGAIHDNNDGED